MDADFQVYDENKNKKKEMHMLPNFSLIPVTGALNNIKGRKKLSCFLKDNLKGYYEKEDSVPIGFAGMRETDKGIFEDSGIAVGVSYTGKGYGKQILSALLSQAFEELGAQKFIYSCWAENIPSNKLAESAGLKFSHSEEAIDRRSGGAITMNFYER